MMPKLGEPYDPQDPHAYERPVEWVPIKSMPEPDLSGGVQLVQREGVFAHSFKCMRCTLHFVLFSWSLTGHSKSTVICPECGGRDEFLHKSAQLSTSREFRFDAERELEIYDVWPFRLT
jgi:DNA-directed RNA polymerase subunit RPC12/RpoP